MSTSPTSPPHSEPGETLEAIPWERLSDPAPDPRRWYRMAAIVVGAGLILAFVRTLIAPDPVPPAAPVTTTIPAEPVMVAPPTTVPFVTEADLMAVEPGELRRAAAASAELAVAAFFSGETAAVWPDLALDPGRVTFVELTRAVAVEETGPGRFVVTVVVSVLDAADGETFSRRAPRAVAQVVESVGDGFRPAELPYPVPVPMVPFIAPTTASAPVDPAVIAVASQGLSSLGTAAAEPLDYGALPDGAVRVVLSMTDDTGATWPVAVTVEPGGRIRPPG